ncbi:MAG: metallophosphoesterase [Clostridiales bacterium]|nr:metallophosphoesterase [Clostridiales bacterium]
MRKKIKILLSVVLIIVAVTIADGIYCTNVIHTTYYSFTNDKNDAAMHFVLISDLHNKEFGEDNVRLVNKIKEQNPDFIAVDGDMVTRYFEDDSVMKELLSQLTEIAPVYCCLGNHERDLADKIDFESEINSTGALLLDNEYIEFDTGNGTVLIGGMSDYPYYEYDAPDYDNDERYFWDDFKEASENQYSILLHHQPEYIGNIVTDSNVDLVLCGHTHGGLIRLPFIGGLFAPNQGFFPEYDTGQFDFGTTHMVITSGLGNSNPLFRINNCAEICVIDIN